MKRGLLLLIMICGVGSAADERIELRIYDISDLLPAQTDFPGPELSLAVVESPSPAVQKVLDRAIQKIHAGNPDAWKEEGVAIEVRGGRLVIMHRPALHKQVNEILEKWREEEKKKLLEEKR